MKNNYFKKAVAALGVAALTVAFSSQANAQSGLALVLDGTSQYMTVPNNAAFNVTTSTSITITLKFKTTTAADGARLFGRRDNAAGVGFEGFLGNGGNLQVGPNVTRDGGGGGVGGGYNTVTNMKDGNWHYVAMVLDNSTAGAYKTRLRVDNTETSTAQVVNYAITTAYNLVFGAQSGNFARKFAGTLDDIRIYNYALTSTDLDADKALASVNGSTPGLVAAWDFENVSGSTVPNVQGNSAFDGTLVGNPVLPLNITDFSALVKSNSINYAWTTANEKGVSHFEPEYSTDGTNFTKAGEITAKGNGSYTFAYAYGATAGQVYVRVKAVDLDGSSTTSKVIALSISNTASFTISPNPVADVITIDNPVEGASANLSITNTQGQTVISTTFTGSKAQINVSALAKGVYIAKLSVAGTTQVLKFIKK